MNPSNSSAASHDDSYSVVIVSGGQTGVDRAALDFACEQGIPYDGWCPKGRRSEDGTIPADYVVKETPSAEYRQRTQWNVRDTDGTLIVANSEPLAGGTLLTRKFAEQLGKPCIVVTPPTPAPGEVVRGFVKEHGIRRLNVAGPRASKEPGIGEFTKRVLTETFC